MSKQKAQRCMIPVKAAERLSDQYDCPVIIIYAIEHGGERFTVTTYGATKPLCRHAADLGRKFAEAVMSGKVAPAPKEPLDVPNEPTLFESVDNEIIAAAKNLLGFNLPSEGMPHIGSEAWLEARDRLRSLVGE